MMSFVENRNVKEPEGVKYQRILCLRSGLDGSILHIGCFGSV